MTKTEKPQIYRDVIDHLVDVCRNGQGQIAARRVRAAVWNANASAEFLHDQHEINLFLGRMAATVRDILAQLLAKEVELGVFESLKALEQFAIKPFESGYEGSSYNDFVGRLNGWECRNGDKPASASSGVWGDLTRTDRALAMLAFAGCPV